MRSTGVQTCAKHTRSNVQKYIVASKLSIFYKLITV